MVLGSCILVLRRLFCMTGMFGVLTLFFLLAVHGIGAQSPQASTAVFIVNSTVNPVAGICDEGECTLREAISAANADPDPDTITFADGLNGDIALGEITIRTDLDIQGAGAQVLSISGHPSANDAIFDIGGELSVQQFTVTISGLTIQNGGGGGIRNNRSNLTVKESTIRDNPAEDYFGGGIHNGGTLTLLNSTLHHNVGRTGGGLYNYGTTTVVSSTFSGNSVSGVSGEGGGIHNEGGVLTVTHTAFISNTPDGSGGGIANMGVGTATVQNSTFISNRGGGLYNEDSFLNVVDSTFISNSGGGIGNVGGTVIAANSIFSGNSARYGGAVSNEANDHVGSVTLVNSTLSHNHAVSSDGGGIYNRGGTFTVTHSTLSQNSARVHGGGVANMGGGSFFLANSTISGNEADGFGGGVYNGTSDSNDSSIVITSSTIVLNHSNADDFDSDLKLPGDENGGGILNTDDATLGSTILASNYEGSDTSALDNLATDPNAPGQVTSLGFNLSDSSPSGFGTDDLPNIAPGIAPLADNGGPTMTHALRFGSAAIDGGSNDACPAVDQRGVTRPRDGDGDSTAVCDIGALEVESPLEPVDRQVFLPAVST